MEYSSWSPAHTTADGKTPKDELLVTFDQKRSVRVLVIPAMFDEVNKLRRFTITVMRALDAIGIDCALPDWPGTHESLAPKPIQTLAGWKQGAKQAIDAFEATHTLSVRAGALLTPSDLPGWQYAPIEGAKLLSGMLRAQAIASREAGHSETRESLMERGRNEGLTLGGWPIGPELLRELEGASPMPNASQTIIDQAQLGGSGLWLRAEPGEDANQANALAKFIAHSVGLAEDSDG